VVGEGVVGGGLGWVGKGDSGRRGGACVGEGLWVMGFRKNHIRNI
jgi:hypothetical protein